MTFAVKDILRMEVAPALGCTEPVAIALGAAAAASLLPGGPLDSIEVWVDPNIYKNGIAVLIPGTGGLFGLDLAAALGALGGDPARKLEVLESIDEPVVKKAQGLLRDKKVKLNLLDERGLRIKTVVTSGPHTAESEITHMHDNIISLRLDGRPVSDSPLLAGAGPEDQDNRLRLEDWLRSQSLERFLDLVDELDEEDLKFLEQSVTYNLRLAEYGLKHGPGLGVGKTMDRLVRQRLIKKDMILAARMLTSAAADARMAGVKLPAMSSAGSGNHGLTAVLPIWAVKDYVECETEDILRAIGLSHIITAYVKTHTGRLSAVCGCSVAAGAGAASGVTYLLGGDIKHMAGAIMNLIQDLAGVVCDGAKAGCAIKLATAAGTAVQASLFALQGVTVQPTDGIIDTTMERTATNLGTLSNEGMIEADHTILQILLNKVLTSQPAAPNS
ncbi:MAG: serine dehydratase subunit alpha family protein [Desulfarculus sp.]|nr:MAG: serine dehydratase subunit alpha family protein [Desulfarculus sp.]